MRRRGEGAADDGASAAAEAEAAVNVVGRWRPVDEAGETEEEEDDGDDDDDDDDEARTGALMCRGRRWKKFRGAFFLFPTLLRSTAGAAATPATVARDMTRLTSASTANFCM